MKSTPWAVLAAMILTAFCAFSPVTASAQGRDDAYAVSGVYVDETAANSAEAQQQGFASAYRIGFERLARRLTLPADHARIPQLEGPALERLALSVDVEQERRSGTRYIGRLTVRFDPEGVRSLLQGAGLTIVDTRTAPVLAVPVATPDTSPETLALWREVWEQGGFASELVPLRVAPANLTGAPNWTNAQPFVGAAAATAALYATLRVQGATATADLVEVTAAGPRSRGEVTARIGGTGDAALRGALVSLAEQANLQIQNEYKARTGASTAPQQRSRVSASALYSDQRQWERIKDALEGAASTLISEIRIEAVGREGALVSFSYVGDLDQLGAELNRRGVSLEQSQYGPVLRVRR